MPCVENGIVNAKVFTYDVFMVCSRDETPPQNFSCVWFLFVTEFGQICVVDI